MKTSLIKIYQTEAGDATHYIYRSKDKPIPKLLEEFVNNNDYISVVDETVARPTLTTLNNVSMTVKTSPKGYNEFSALSLPFTFATPGSVFKIEFKNNVEITDKVTYTIYAGLNVIFKVIENKDGTDKVITDPNWISDNFKIDKSKSAIFVRNDIAGFKQANYYGQINIYDYFDTGDLQTGASRAHGIYDVPLEIIETPDYISFYQNAEKRKNLYYYNVITKFTDGTISEISNTQVCELSENSDQIIFELEYSDDFHTSDNPTWTQLKTAAPVEDIRVYKKDGDLVSAIIPIDNFAVFANDYNVKLDNTRELKLTNIWNSDNRKLMERPKRVFRARNVYKPNNKICSEYTKPVVFDDNIEILIDKIMILRKDVTTLAPNKQSLPISIKDGDATTLKVFVRQGGIYYKDFFLQNNNTNDPDGDVSNQVISAVTLDSKYPLLKVKDDCIYGNKYNYTIYLYDELGKVSEPITVVL